MNAYAAVVLAALLLEFGLDLAADVLNLRALSPELPAEFRDVYDAARYRRAQEYARTRTRFGFIPATFDLVVVLIFWFAGGFATLDAALGRLGLGPIATGVLFLGALAVGRAVLNLPFSWWSTFVIEERFGFNTTKPRTFWTDRVKGLALSALLGGPLVAVILWLFAWAGPVAWLWCWLVTALYFVVMQYVAPTWLMPLFNRFTPLAEGTLRDAILAYAGSVGFPVQGLFVIDGSRRSTKANAFFTGFGKRKRIALFDTLIAKHDVEQVVAVVAHEIGHYKRRHVLQGTVVSIAHAGVVFYLLAFFLGRPGLFEAFYVHTPSTYAGFVFVGLLLNPLELALSLFLHAWSRHHELEADRFAAETTGSGERLASALKRLAADTLTNLTPHPLYVLLHYSHPPLRERVRALDAH
jgi:STE24 endopeptidase